MGCTTERNRKMGQRNESWEQELSSGIVTRKLNPVDKAAVFATV